MRVYQVGGEQWLNNAPLYENFPGPFNLPFTYPPFAAVLFSAVALLPWGLVVALWTIGGLALFTGACLAAAWHIPQRTMVIGLLVAAACLVLDPIRGTLELGQINMLLMGLVALDCLLPRTPWPRGMLIGIAAAIKLTPAIFILFFLPRKQWQPAVTAVLTFIGTAVIGWALAPKDSAAFWLHAMLDPGRVGGLAYTSNQSIKGLLFRLGIGTPLWALLCVAVVALAWFVVARSRDDLAAMLAVATAGLLVSPVSWSHHWVWIGPALIYLYVNARKALIPVALVFAIGPHWLLPNTGDQELQWSWWQHIVGNSYVWLGLALLVHLARQTRKPSIDRRIDAVVQTT
ncbi:membrane protein [Lentzea sp. NBRC 105346]|uniref:glycosyltransferase 87 family protein n=1 Tax=Lentzea sp. NBRC 105346 TaxID=3032205 RepID=UPI0024A1C2C1|nr:glycosyltransferase 87 family protein [Lentzea sp. NBRC 105346]GLZ31455.1 membrane protein [Lentzea sp. NBRC 105346]